MLLHELVLHNVGVFRGRQSLDLRPLPSRPIVLVGGLNGRGKTTILEALQLVLYGRRAPAARATSLSYDEYLKRLTHRTIVGREGAAIELEFSSVSEARTTVVRVHRSWTHTRAGVAREQLDVYLDGQRSAVAAERWADAAEDLLPTSIAELFFFDGERLEQLANPDTAANVIGTAVDALLGIGTVDRLNKDLHALERRWRISGAGTKAQQQLAELQTELSELESQRSHITQDLAQLRNELDRAAQTVENANIAFVRGGGDLAVQRDALQRHRKELEGRRHRILVELVEISSGAMPLLLVDDLLHRTMRQAEVERSASVSGAVHTALSLRDRFVVELLARYKVSAVARKGIADALVADLEQHDTATDPPIINASAELPLQISNARLQANRDSLSARELIANLEEVALEITELDTRLDAAPPDEVVVRLIERQRTTRADLDRITQRSQLIEEQLAAITTRIADRKRTLDRLIEIHADDVIAAEDRARLLDHADRTRETLAKFRSAMLQRQLGVIEVSVLKALRQLLDKQRLLSSVTIDPGTFAITLTTQDDEDITTDQLSAGERQLLATALLWGLAKASGRRLPMAIDTPLGRLDSAHRRNLVERYFPFAAQQLLLLSTDEEIDADLHQLLLPYVAREFTIAYDDNTGASILQEGYFWETTHVA